MKHPELTTKPKSPRFNLGSIYLTPGASEAIGSLQADHWTLAVGIGSPENQPPGLPVIAMCPWNATLTLNPTRGWRVYETARGLEKVRLTEAICLSNANP